MKHCLILSREIFYVTIVLFKYSMTESSQLKILRGKHELASQNLAKKLRYLKSIEYLTTEIKLVLPTFKSWKKL